MKSKKLWIVLWILTIIAVFIVSLINNKPYLLMGGSSSVAPVMEELISAYPENHKEVDFNYISSASSGAPPRVANGLFGVGWLSKEYTTKDPNLFTFQMMRDGLVIVYNIPKNELVDPTVPLDFTPEKVQDLYLNHKTWKQVFPNQIIDDNLKVQTFTRANGSGTRDVFDEKCLDGVTFYDANTTDSSSAMLNLDLGSVGYSSFADLTQANPDKITSSAGTWEGTEANFNNIKNQSYKLTRPFTGLINRNFKNAEAVVQILKWVFSENTETDKIFKKYGPRVELDDPVNATLKVWLEQH